MPHQNIFRLLQAMLFIFLAGIITFSHGEERCQHIYYDLSSTLDRTLATQIQDTAAYYDALHAVEDELFSAFNQCRDNPLLLTLMGEIQISLGNLQLAYLYAQKAMSRDGAYWQTFHLLGTTLCMQERFTEGLPHLEQAARLAPEKAVLQFNLCSTYVTAKKYDAAIKSCTALLQRRDHELYGPVYFLRAQAYQALGKPKLAKQDFDNARLLDYIETP